jgi:hypothetical protein
MVAVAALAIRMVLAAAVAKEQYILNFPDIHKNFLTKLIKAHRVKII